MRTRFLCLMIFSVVILFGFESAKACSCVRSSTCEMYSNANAVFVAKVLDSKIDTRDLRLGDNPNEIPLKAKFQVSRLQIKESFIGINAEKEIEIETDNYSSCFFSLAKDAEYLVYGYKDEKTGKFSTGFCSGTKLVNSAKEDLEYLRALKNTMGMTVKGFVGYSSTGEYLYRNYLPKNNFTNLLKLGVTTLSLQNPEKSFQTKIKSDGTYSFENVPNGKYSLKVVLPESLKSLENYNPDIAEEIGITDQSLIEASGHGCHIEDFTIVDNGRVSGKVVDVNGKPVEDISVYLIPVNAKRQRIKTKEECYDNGLCLDTNKEGNFSFQGIPAGNYLVGIRLDDYVSSDSIDAAYPTTYFPNSKSPNTAKIISIQKGKSAQHIEIKLFPKFQERTIQGRVFFKDGRPAPKVFVRYVARTPDYKNSGLIFIETDENGFFSFAGYENHGYLIGSFTDQRQGNEFAFAIEQEIFIKGNPKELKFVLDHTDIEKCKECKDYLEYPKRPKIKKK